MQTPTPASVQPHFPGLPPVDPIAALRYRKAIDGELGRALAVLAEIGCPEQHLAPVRAHVYTEAARRKRWIFTMVSQENLEVAIHRIAASARPATNFKVFMLVLARLDPDTGVVPFDYKQAAEILGILPNEASRSLTELANWGFLQMLRDDGKPRYWINPHVAWNGKDDRRRARARTVKTLALPV